MTAKRKLRGYLAITRLIFSTLSLLPRFYRNWPVVILDYLGLWSGKPVIFQLRTGEKFKSILGKRDSLIINEVYLLHQYDDTQSNIDILPGNIVVDIGAYIGDFTILAAKKTGPTGRVYAVEPTLKSFDLLQANIKLNATTNVQCDQIAISSTNQPIDFYQNKYADFGNSTNPSSIYKSKTKIQSSTLKKYLSDKDIRHIDYLKIDCEGSEWEILSHFPPNIASHISIIAVEFHFLKHTRKDLDLLVKKLAKDGLTAHIDDRFSSVDTAHYFFTRKNFHFKTSPNIFAASTSVTPLKVS